MYLSLEWRMRYLSTSGFAGIMGVSRVTVTAWIKRGWIKAYNVHVALGSTGAREVSDGARNPH